MSSTPSMFGPLALTLFGYGFGLQAGSESHTAASHLAGMPHGNGILFLLHLTASALPSRFKSSTGGECQHGSAMEPGRIQQTATTAKTTP